MSWDKKHIIKDAGLEGLGLDEIFKKHDEGTD